ncbi:hypothetical protein DB35_06350 [Streptomyces abyssalis]|uniref:Integral membrane protein n=1 Tax=Streptomyces abyssalis TaxID=933944 RepID=A0A1E7JT60_9ACTN|nr:hypothetical protein [Streptomyces abyssalis]OEU92056.1 hypothetical protein AN215_06405 [Streptomyces abyssalis]OEU94664.1 hypothetical protein DB35_06350 [Streptomyces abyssalis]
MAAEDDDALFVLTAVLLTPAQFPSVLGDDYPEACARLGLEPYAEGYGLVLGQDGSGARWTVATDDVTLVACAIAAWDCGMDYDLSPSDRSVAAALPGWPLHVAVSAPGVAAPHDPAPEPETDGGRSALVPPDTEHWGPAQRRLGADEIALQWAVWREQVEDDVEFVDAGESPNESVQRVLKEVREYLHSPPPPGRVRSAFASGEARTLRADGPGWSMVARTDDIAFLLLDDEPGEVLPVGRGAELPGLLEALDGMALRPAA